VTYHNRFLPIVNAEISEWAPQRTRSFSQESLVSIPVPVPPRQLNLAAGDGGDLSVWARICGYVLWDAHGCDQRRLGGNDTTAFRELDGAVWLVGTAALHRFEGDRFTGIAIQEETPGPGHIGLRVTGCDGGLWMAVEG
jgi:hypothetical protein